MTEEDAVRIWELLDRVKDVKVNKYGPSVMAISKFLHFGNPRLFVIVDDGVILDRVLSHAWLWRQVEEVRVRTDRRLSLPDDRHRGEMCDLATYVAILTWAAALLGESGDRREFERYVRPTVNDAAVLRTWSTTRLPRSIVLLGLVELPPCGVHGLEVQGGDV